MIQQNLNKKLNANLNLDLNLNQNLNRNINVNRCLNTNLKLIMVSLIVGTIGTTYATNVAPHKNTPYSSSITSVQSTQSTTFSGASSGDITDSASKILDASASPVLTINTDQKIKAEQKMVARAPISAHATMPTHAPMSTHATMPTRSSMVAPTPLPVTSLQPTSLPATHQVAPSVATRSVTTANATASLSQLPQSMAQPVGQSPQQISMPNLNGIDNSADDLVQLKRKLEIEKAQMELKKLHSGGGNSSSGGAIAPITSAENIQTTVTGVAINQEGRRLAWLQFADGGSLQVNIGSRIGKYVVSDITMNGVQLTDDSGKKHPRNMFLKRAYFAQEKPKNSHSGGGNSLFSPSPIITGANNNSEMVPPITPFQ